ncbi:Calponin-homology (CH) domain-containing protein [Podarcis lilfordi]|uniref:Calponin-homology (CH) domain-containing protein n=2 Tax=Podarcis lilfordi TaxID=74358 RepID=A0AA35JVB1_9SAUR|nr:Calponin-homology (CH) domain-containing protein [Podarcis lilfordi]
MSETGPAGRCGALLTWLQTFHVPSPCAKEQDLASGVTIAQVLHKIDPSWFNETWLLRIKDDAGDNWRLKVSNLKKVLQSVVEYSQDVLGHQVPEQLLPDVALVGELSDTAELGKLLQLVLGCAISCERKQDHIQQIMTLEESVQHVVMTAIQELLNKDSSDTLSSETYGNFDSQSRKYYFLSDDLEETDDMRQRCHDLEQQISILVEEKNTLSLENKSLREQKSSLESDAAGLTGKKLLLLQTQIEQLQEENFRLESSRDDFRVRCEDLEKEVLELQHRNEELTSLAEEAQALKDEMDVLRHSSDKVGRLEAMVDSYKKKLEDLGDLRRQVRLLEERNTVYMQRTCELEEELRRANAVRVQLEAHKRQVQELHSKHADEALKAEKWQFEFKNLKEKFEALVKEKERLIEERDALREANEELRCAQVQQKFLNQADTILEEIASPVDNLAAEIIPAELKETIVRLQHENKMLCAQELSYRLQQTELQGLLEESNRTKNQLEAQQRLSQQQITELKVQVEELQRALQEQGSKAEDSSLLQKKLEEHLEKLHEAHAELQKKKECLDELEPKVDSNTAKKIDELQQSLKKKDEDMRAMEERYKRYMDKACTVIKKLDPKQQPHGVPLEIQALKNQLQEKDKKINHLESDFEKTKSQQEQEEKLIITAWYNMGLALHQRATEERSSTSTPVQSFLAQQRLATNTRRGHLNRAQPLLLRYVGTDKPQLS